MSMCNFSLSKRSRQHYAQSVSSSISTIIDADLVKKIETIEKLYPDIISKSNNELIELKKQYADSGEPDKMLDINTYIEFRAKDNTSYVLSVYKKWISDGLIDAINKYKNNINDIEKEAKNDKEQIRRDYDASKLKNEEKFKSELEKLEYDKNLELEMANSKCSPKAKFLLDRSKVYAKADQIQLAKQFKNEALQEQNKQVKAIEQGINSKYSKLLSKMQKQQQNTENLIKEKYESSLKEIRSRANKDKEEQRKKLEIYINHTQQRAISNGFQELLRKSMRSAFANSIVLYVSDLIREQGL